MLFEVEYKSGKSVGIEVDMYKVENNPDEIKTFSNGMPVMFFKKSEIVSAKVNGKVLYEQEKPLEEIRKEMRIIRKAERIKLQAEYCSMKQIDRWYTVNTIIRNVVGEHFLDDVLNEDLDYFFRERIKESLEKEGFRDIEFIVSIPDIAICFCNDDIGNYENDVYYISYGK